MAEGEAVEPADPIDLGTRPIEDLRREVRHCGLDPPYREDSRGESSPRCRRNSRLYPADGNGGRTFLEVSRVGEVCNCGTWVSDGDQGRRGRGREVEEVFAAG